MSAFCNTALALAVISAAAFADDGQLFRRNVSKTPELETDHATMKMLQLYVPAQTSSGELVTIDYFDAAGALVESRDQAKPLVAFYHDGEVEHVPDVGFPGHGQRDVYGAYSLDDGVTWKRKNLSRSGDLSSFTLRDGTTYYGDTFRLFKAAAGNKVMVAWASRYCQGGNPGYSLTDDEIPFIAPLVGEDAAACSDGNPTTLCMYLVDYWGVAGSQGSVDYGESDIIEYQAIGEVPYACLWTARGTLEADPEPGLYEIAWRQAERLTSGRRDVHRIEVQGVADAGFVVTWQEDPEGLRPGKGEGPGEGWSGAIGNHQTDIWYSYIAWENFDLVYVAGGDPVPFSEYTGDQQPVAGVPLAMPVRLTDNAMCVGSDDNPYCYADFDGTDSADFCASTETVTIETPEGPTMDVALCVTEDGRLLRGNIASTRARTHLRAYEPGIDRDNDGVNDKSAWVVLAYEESKGLGEEDDLDPEKIDMGKNIWYHTFEMFQPELVSQGLMLNQPALYPDELFPSVDYLTAVPYGDGTSFAQIYPDPIYDTQAGLESTLYQAEIARRFSMISQEASKAGPSGTVAFAMFKQGIIRQGGPADILARRFVLPEVFDPAADNPYDYANMVCDEWAFDDGSNPRYVKGLCLAPVLNMSATKVFDCEAGADNCGYEDFPWDELFADLDMSDSSGLPKITEWRQCPGGLDCIDDDYGFDDPTWLNPYDVGKGHRGFIDGDFIMMMYAWSPNWMANSVGHDNYNLDVRRSFDGGVTWMTLPTDYLSQVVLPDGVTVVADGSEHCEWYGPPGTDTEIETCTFYAAGEPEQARNLSRLVGTRLTVLDPRFSPTAGTICVTDEVTGECLDDGNGGVQTLYTDDLKDPSKFFATFETGDNTTVEFGEAEPLDMFYSRAFNFGDEYELVDTDDDGVDDFFDWLEGSKRSHSSEAAVTANPGGTFFYAIWNQEDVDRRGRPAGSDAWMRRIMYLDGYEPPIDDDGDGGGGKDKPKKTK